MSEYQYYEFRAIDSALTANQRKYLSSLSSRARVTSHLASYVFNYSDFHGDTEKLMAEYFDAMVYIANWGSRCLMFRLPPAQTAFSMEAIDANTIEPPVPDGLNDLSSAQQALGKYLEIDEAMILVAAQKNGTQPKKVTLEKWIDKLPVPEQRDYLIRLSRGESNLSLLLNKRIQELSSLKSQPQHNGENTDRRTISALIEASKVWYE